MISWQPKVAVQLAPCIIITRGKDVLTVAKICEHAPYNNSCAESPYSLDQRTTAGIIITPHGVSPARLRERLSKSSPWPTSRCKMPKISWVRAKIFEQSRAPSRLITSQRDSRIKSCPCQDSRIYKFLEPWARINSQMNWKAPHDDEQESLHHDPEEEFHKLISIFSIRQRLGVERLSPEQLISIPPPEKFKRKEKQRTNSSAASSRKQQESSIQAEFFDPKENTYDFMLMQVMETPFDLTNENYVKLHQIE
jgi:hypothetical protein